MFFFKYIKYLTKFPFKFINEIIKQITKKKTHEQYSKCIFFSSRSFLSVTEILFPIKEYPSRRRKIYNNKNQRVIFVKSSKIHLFEKYLKKNLSEKFILISGDSDYSISNEFYDEKIIKKILNNTNLIVWYSQNINFRHEKLRSIPHGVDYHTIWERRKDWVKSRIIPKDQESKLLDISSESKNVYIRENKIYHNWHFSLHHGLRSDYFEFLKKNEENFFLKKKLNKFENFQEQVKYKYIFCPQGKGMDDPRVYESLILGNIVVRINDNLNFFFSDLPIIHINKIEELNIKFLNMKTNEFKNKKFNFSKLENDYWFKKIGLKDKTKFNLHGLTLEEFKITINSIKKSLNKS